MKNIYQKYRSAWREPLDTDDSEEDEWRSSKSKKKKHKRVRKFSETSEEETEASYESESEDDYRKKRRRLSSRSEEEEETRSSNKKAAKKHSDESEEEPKHQNRKKRKDEEEESDDEEEEEEEEDNGSEEGDEESSEEETLIGTKRQIIRSDDEDETAAADKTKEDKEENKETNKDIPEECHPKEPEQQDQDVPAKTPANNDQPEQLEPPEQTSLPVERKGVIVLSNMTPKRRIIKEESSSESEEDKGAQEGEADAVEDLSINRQVKRESSGEAEPRFPPTNSVAKAFADPYSEGAAPIEEYNRPRPLKPAALETYSVAGSPSKLTPLDSYPQSSSRGTLGGQFERGTPSPHSRNVGSPDYRSLSDQYRPQGCFQYGVNQQSYYPPSYGTSPVPSSYPAHGSPQPPEEEYRNYPPGTYPPVGGPPPPHFYGGQNYYPPPQHDEQVGPLPPNCPPGGPYPYYGQSGHPPNGGFMIDNLLRSRNPEGGGEEDDLTGVTDIVSYITQE